MGSKIKRLRAWCRTFCWVRVESWRFGPLLIQVCALGWRWPKIAAGNYQRGSVIERGPWLTIEPVFGLLVVSWQPHWADKTESCNPPF